MEAKTVRDIYEVLRKKQAEQAQLGKQIEALQLPRNSSAA